MSARHKSFFLSTSFFISREHFSEVISLFALDGIRQTHTVSKIPAAILLPRFSELFSCVIIMLVNVKVSHWLAWPHKRI